MLMMNRYNLDCLSQAHDYPFHYQRFVALMNALKEGTFPYYTDYAAVGGYGYLTKIFYPDFILIPFAALGLLFGAETGFYSLIVVMTLLCALFTYMAVYKIYRNRFAAFAASILYTFCLYRLIDFFYRFALGEAISFTFIPIVLLGLHYIIYGDYRKWYIITIGYSLLIFTHVLSSFLMSVTVVLLLLVNVKRLVKEPKRILYLLFAGLATIIITSYYLLPLLEQTWNGSFYFSTSEEISAHWNRLRTDQLIVALFGGFLNKTNGFIPGIGIILTLGIFIRFFVKGKSDTLRKADIGVIIGILYIWGASWAFPWGTQPFYSLSFIQFPWRLFEFTSYFFAVGTGVYLSFLIKPGGRRLATLSLITVLTAFMMFRDGKLHDYIICNDNSYTFEIVSDGYGMGSLEYIPSKVPDRNYMKTRGDSIGKRNDDTQIEGFARDKALISLNVDVNRTDVIELPLFYYLGYTAELNGEEIPVGESQNGLIQIPVNRSGEIKVYYKGTSLQKISWYTTIVSLFSLCIYIFVIRRKCLPK